MTFTEYVMKAGSWTVDLDPATPTAIRERIDVRTAAYSTLVILPVHLPVGAIADADMLALARYVGIYRRQRGLTLTGAGLGIMVGDEDGRGDVIEAPRGTVNGWLSQWFAALIPAGLQPGALTSPGGVWGADWRFFMVNHREAWETLCAAFGVEWRVRPTFHFDVAPAATLYGSTPRAVILGESAGASAGRDLTLTGVTGGTDLEVDQEEYATKSIIFMEMDSERAGADNVATKGTAGSDIYRAPMGHPLIRDQAKQVETSDFHTGTLDEMHWGKQLPRLSWSIDTAGAYDLATDCPVGSPIWLYDPAQGLQDMGTPVAYRGAQIYPAASRLMGMTTPISAGMGVYLRTMTGPGAATWTDLSPYVVPESGRQRIELGSTPRPTSNPRR